MASRRRAGDPPAPAPPPAATARRGRGRRLAVVYDVEPPHVRLGILWFVVVMASLVAGVGALALVYGLTAGLAGYQAARCWRIRKPNRPDPVVAAIAGLLVALGAAVSVGMLGIAVLVAVVLAVLRAFTETKAPFVATAGRTLQCGLWPGAAAAGVVTSYRFELWAAVALVLAVSAYETGDYLVGSGSRNKYEGPIAGIVATLVVLFAVAAIGLPPFEISNGLQFGVLAAVLCPAGQVVASLVLPAAAAPAPAMRRLDSLLLLGPVWALTAGAVAAQAT
jgi:hypothetical protein